MGNKKIDLWLNKVLKTLPFILITALILIPVGIIFLCIPHETPSAMEHSEDYTDCMLFSFGNENKTCAQSMLIDNEPCICYYYFNITENLEGDVAVFYELDSFDQLRNDYVNSRDDNQLIGNLDQLPSEKCEPYRFVETSEGRKPILPCGAIADAMFNDSYVLRDVSNDKLVPLLFSGILSEAEKVGYHNPMNITDLKNFEKPKSWKKYIWELDNKDPNNNGFQNEKFIGWMKTEWKRKPYARVDHNVTHFENGLPSGKYELRVAYNYPPTRYNGRRKIILTATLVTLNTTFIIIGIISLVTGLILLAIASVAFVMHKRIKGNVESNNRDLTAQENLTNNY